MSWRTNSLIVMLRNVGRRIGLNRLIMTVVGSPEYEDRFQTAMLADIRAGDRVWDVGANVGLYSVKLARLVGPAGKVIAFEPSPTNYAQLKNSVGTLGNIVLMPLALGDTKGKISLRQGDDPLGATSQLVKPEEKHLRHDANDVIEVELCRGDELVLSGEFGVPNVIKIDTEGFELEVVRGLRQILKNPELRQLGIEVHFGLLTKRGLAQAPHEIESLLRDSGFQCDWPDGSHIVAKRID